AAEGASATEEGAAEIATAEGSAAEAPIAADGQLVEEEGPEPARIPTSLTATLREQGPRYLHRVSRRMRRRGREGREGREGRDGREGRESRGLTAGGPGGAPEPRPREHSTGA